MQPHAIGAHGRAIRGFTAVPLLWSEAALQTERMLRLAIACTDLLLGPSSGMPCGDSLMHLGDAGAIGNEVSLHIRHGVKVREVELFKIRREQAVDGGDIGHGIKLRRRGSDTEIVRSTISKLILEIVDFAVPYRSW